MVEGKPIVLADTWAPFDTSGARWQRFEVRVVGPPKRRRAPATNEAAFLPTSPWMPALGNVRARITLTSRTE